MIRFAPLDVLRSISLRHTDITMPMLRRWVAIGLLRPHRVTVGKHARFPVREACLAHLIAELHAAGLRDIAFEQAALLMRRIVCPEDTSGNPRHGDYDDPVRKILDHPDSDLHGFVVYPAGNLDEKERIYGVMQPGMEIDDKAAWASLNMLGSYLVVNTRRILAPMRSLIADGAIEGE
ncbi:MAG: hypothetical protein H6882_02585 [Rhodobiaceae bacterium]|nr:hypothetical protein [Rhodobiaceae bacterium]